MPNKNPPYIYGQRVRLRPATMADRRVVYEALACSELTEILIGRPGSLGAPAITWKDFCDDHRDYYFDDSNPMGGRCFIIEVEGAAVGQVYYNGIFGVPRRTEIDTWMFSEANCGRGYGPDALRTLCDYLASEWGVEEFFIMPSAENPRAIRAYEKAGFRRSPLSLAEAEARYRCRDDEHTVYMVRTT